MRDPKRIPKILARLQRAWDRHPDLRLAQIILNVSASSGVSDPYYVDDEKLIEYIEKALARRTKAL